LANISLKLREITINFVFSWKAVENNDSFPWHREAYKTNASQALAIDLFGFIQMSNNRDFILNELAFRNRYSK
jgi:hypothetical protein